MKDVLCKVTQTRMAVMPMWYVILWDTAVPDIGMQYTAVSVTLTRVLNCWLLLGSTWCQEAVI